MGKSLGTRFMRFGRFALLVALASAGPALAHPHVWVSSKAVIVYGADGRIAAIRQGWTFDEGYSTYAVQGFETGPDGKIKPEKLAELAKINMESLADSGFFTQIKTNGARQSFGEPVNYATRFEDGKLTLTFDLPLKAAAKGDRLVTLEVYDPTFFVDFAIAPGDDAITMQGAPNGCVLRVNRPKPEAVAAAQGVSEAMYNALGAASNYGAQLASRVMIACP